MLRLGQGGSSRRFRVKPKIRSQLLRRFKAAQIASQLPGIDKVLFIVDRKDLDYQTMKEYDRFEKGAANSNCSTAVLKKQLENPNARIIITTIQKLAIFIRKHKEHEVYLKHCVMIFDEHVMWRASEPSMPRSSPYLDIAAA